MILAVTFYSATNGSFGFLSLASETSYIYRKRIHIGHILAADVLLFVYFKVVTHVNLQYMNVNAMAVNFASG